MMLISTKILICLSSTLLIFASCTTDSNPDVDDKFIKEETDVTEFIKLFGGSGSENVRSVIQTSDGGYLIAGYSSSNDGDFQNTSKEFRYSDQYDAFLLKLNRYRIIEWVKTYGGNKGDRFEQIFRSEGGFTIFGHSTSDDGPFGSHDQFVVNLNIDGEILSVESLPSELNGYVSPFGTGYRSIVKPLSNEKYLIGSYPESRSSTLVTLNNDFSIINKSDIGNGVWIVGLDNDDSDAHIVAGYTNSTNEPFEDLNSELLPNSYNSFIGKVGRDGELQWLNSYGGRENDIMQGFVKTNDGNFVIGGVNSTNDGDFEGFGGEFQRGINQLYLISIDANGETNWIKTYGGSGASNYILSMIEMEDGAIAMLGVTSDPKLSDKVSSFGPSIFIANFSRSGELIEMEFFSNENNIIRPQILPPHVLYHPFTFREGNNLFLIDSAGDDESSIYFLEYDLSDLMLR